VVGGIWRIRGKRAREESYGWPLGCVGISRCLYGAAAKKVVGGRAEPGHDTIESFIAHDSTRDTIESFILQGIACETIESFIAKCSTRETIETFIT
jgi:hypothetical protein